MSERTLRLARKTAESRRALLRIFGPELGTATALDLMQVQLPTPEQVQMAREISKFHLTSLAEATLYLADSDMVALLDVAAPSMPDQPLNFSDLPAPNGFVFMAEPLPDSSGSYPSVPIQAFSWAQIPAGHPMTTGRDPREAVLLTSFVNTAENVVALGHDPAKVLSPTAPRLMANATVIWTFGTLIGTVFGDVPTDPQHTPGFYQRLAAAFWTLSQQPKMTATDHAPSGRPTDHRKWRRAGIANAAADVRVIRLQHPPTPAPRAAGEQGEPGPAGDTRRISVRFPIRGHWRNQWFSSVEEHRHIWIDPHWKGPENAPVVGAERVFLATAPPTPPDPAGS